MMKYCTRRISHAFTWCCAIFLLYVCNGSALINSSRSRLPERYSRQLSTRARKQIQIPPIDQQLPVKVMLVVEPTPFNYVSGYANRFKEMLMFMRKAGDEVRVLTPDSDPNPPKQFLGYPIVSPRGFELPMYKHVTLTLDLRFKLKNILKDFKPDLIHVSTPSFVVFPTILWARMMGIPLVMSYHTDFTTYAKSYLGFPGSVALAHWLLKTMHRFADLVLCTSPQLKADMEKANIRRVDVWQKGINTERFSPKYRNSTMRDRLTEGRPESPLLLYVGRLGVEKRIDRLKNVLDSCPGARLALVGMGPASNYLKQVFSGYPVHFAGEMHGDELSAAYASSDIFCMPSDSETLGFVVLEALASGLPTVCVSAGGLVDLGEDGKTGFLVENKDNMLEFTACVKELISNSTMRRSMGSAGVEWAKDWSWESATSVLRNIQYPRAVALHKSRDRFGRHSRHIETALMMSTSSGATLPSNGGLR